MVTLRQAHYDEIVSHALSKPDQEVCGVLGGRDGASELLFRAGNTAENPRTRFEMDSRDILHAIRTIEDGDADLIGFYHSHTHTQAYPSPTDVAMWQGTWGDDALCFICSLMDEERPQLRAFHISTNGAIAEEPISVSE